MTAKIYCVVGKKNSGKTTFIEKLIAELTRRGIRVGTVKHDLHGFEMDKPGKDTWRHKQAGASAVVISSPAKVAAIIDVEAEPGLEALAKRFMGSVDIVVAEGFFSSDMPKIEIFRTDEHDQPLSSRENASERNVIAIVSDGRPDAGAPVFALDDVAGIADLILSD